MLLIYRFALVIYDAIIRIAALSGNAKARLWVEGRKNWRSNHTFINKGNAPVYWFHASSLGEYEQGLPLMQAIRINEPDSKIVLTFFSPSGYEIRKNTPIADAVFYLPQDNPRNAKDFIRFIRPNAAFFIKYEFWFFYINELKQQGIPVYGVSCIFRPGQHFFQWYGSFFRSILKKFEHLFVQDLASTELLRGIGIEKVTVSGDTRFDRVIQNQAERKKIPFVEKFVESSFVLVAGSTWPADEELIFSSFKMLNRTGMRIILAPHETDASSIDGLKKRLDNYFKPEEYLFYSQKDSSQFTDQKVLIIDSIGLLSSLYGYGNIAYLGGGFNNGIHNVLEAAVFGMPVFFGPKYGKFREARDLIAAGAAVSVNDQESLFKEIQHLILDPSFLKCRSEKSREYVIRNSGATKLILEKLQESKISI